MRPEALAARLDRLAEHTATLEALLVELMTTGELTLEEIEVRAASTFARGFSRDVEAAQIIDYPNGPMLRVTTHREGLYDKLPQALFHRPEPRAADEPLERRLETYKATRREELEARKFFFPFEQESFLFALKCERRERALIDNFGSSLRTRLLLDIWPACTRVPASYHPSLSYILTLSYRIAGDLPLMEACFSALAQVQVTLAYEQSGGETGNTGQDRNLAADHTMGDILGVDTVIATAPAAELPDLIVTVGPIERPATAGFLPGGEVRAVLDLLSECLVPLEVDVRYAFTYHDTDDELVLGGESPAAGSYLGYTSVIALA